MNYKEVLDDLSPEPISNTFNTSNEVENKNEEEEEEEKLENHKINYLEDTQNFQDSLKFFKNVTKNYREDVHNTDLEKEIFDVTEFIFDTINNFEFEIKQFVIDNDFFESISETIYYCNNIDILYQLLICLGICIEKHPELIEISSFTDVCQSVYDALDRYANKLLSPALRIFTLSSKEYDQGLWEKIVEFIEWSQTDEYLVLFWEIVTKFSTLWYKPPPPINIQEIIDMINPDEEEDPEEKIEELKRIKTIENAENTRSENTFRLKEILKGIQILLCEKNILDGSLDALLNICDIIIDNNDELQYLWYLFLSPSSNPCIEFVFDKFIEMPEMYLGRALHLIYLCSLYNDCQPYLFTMLKKRFDQICDFADKDDNEIRDYSAMIICLLFEGNHLSDHTDPIQAIRNIVDYLHDFSLRVKVQAVKSISEGLKHYIQYPELLEIIAENGFVSDVIDLYDCDDIKTKRVVIEAIRRMSCYPSDEIKEGMKENYEEFLVGIEEYDTDEIIQSKLDVIYAFLNIQRYQDTDDEN